MNTLQRAVGAPVLVGLRISLLDIREIHFDPFPACPFCGNQDQQRLALGIVNLNADPGDVRIRCQMNPQSDRSGLARHGFTDPEITFRPDLFRFGTTQRQGGSTQFRCDLLRRGNIGPLHPPCTGRNRGRIIHRIQQQPLAIECRAADPAIVWKTILRATRRRQGE